MCVTQLCKRDELLEAEIEDFCTHKKPPVFVAAIVRISKKSVLLILRVLPPSTFLMLSCTVFITASIVG